VALLFSPLLAVEGRGLELGITLSSSSASLSSLSSTMDGGVSSVVGSGYDGSSDDCFDCLDEFDGSDCCAGKSDS
jgi:hypothetical protein